MATCPRCGSDINDNAVFCSKCGQKLGSETDRLAKDNRTKRPRQERQGCGMSLAVILTAAVVVIVILGIGAGAIYMGLNDRNASERDMAQEHYEQGAAYLDEGQTELGIAELELAVQLDPEHTEAQTLLDQARRQLEAEPTPEPPPQDQAQKALLTELQSVYGQGNWSQAVNTADRLIAMDPDYERAEVNGMLLPSLITLGQETAAKGQIGDALALFDRALTIDPANAQALRERELASMYASVLAAWNIDWPAAIENLTALYTTAPTYLDVEDRLFDAHIAQGDKLASEQAWCDAVEAYAAAMDIRLSTQVVERHQEATAKCQAANATPDNQAGQSETPSSPAGQTPGPAGPAGTYVAQVAKEEHLGGKTVSARGHVYDKAGRAVAGTRVQIQAWDWTAVAVTDADGQFSFDGLSNPVTFTFTLLDLPSMPFDVGLQEGVMTWVVFRQAP